jgi:hypothetical protein
MSSESVTILVEADDRASKQIAQTSKNVEASIKSIKEGGQKAKASTEFFGVLASVTGNSELAGLAGQLGQVTEKVGQFSEVQKLGGAGALAFKAGLVGLVGVIAYQLGSAIGNVIFETEKWNEKLAEANKLSQELAQKGMAALDKSFTRNREDIELIRDPEQKKKAYEDLLETLNKNIIGTEGKIKSSKKAVDEWAEAWKITGDRKGFEQQAKDTLANEQARLAQMNKQKEAITDILTREKELADIKAQNAALDKSESYVKSLREELEITKATGAELSRLQALKGGAMGDDVGLAAGILAEIDASKKLAEAEKKAVEDQKKKDDMLRSQVSALEKQAILLKDGAQAAREYELIQQGIDASTAKQLAMAEEAIEKAKQKAAIENPELSAFSSRLLTRGTVTKDNTKEVAENTAKTAAGVMELVAEIKSKLGVQLNLSGI